MVQWFLGPFPESISQNVLHRPPVQSDVNRQCVQKGSVAEGVKNTKSKKTKSPCQMTSQGL